MSELPFDLGPYTVERELARGGMGVVYAGQDRKLKRPVAIKSVAEPLLGQADFMARFSREARLLAKLNCAHVATVYGIEETAGKAYLVMELIDGESLAERLRRAPLSIEEALKIAASIATGVAAAHDEGVVHRDIKPGNVMLGRKGEVKVLDFGLALRQDDTIKDDSLGPLTATGMVLGSPGYMSPEQARGEKVDSRTDVFAFGCVLYECLTRLRVFTGRDNAEAIDAILHKDPDWSCLPANTPQRIRELLERCLQKLPADRLRDLGDARIEIEAALVNREWSKQPDDASRGPSRRVLAAVAFACGLALSPLLFGPGAADDETLPRVTRFEVLPPRGHRLRLYTPSIKLSPSARYLSFYTDTDAGWTETFVRGLDQFRAHPVMGGVRILEPTFSPDEQWLAFNNGGKVYKTRVNVVTTPELIADSRAPYGMAWLESDWLVLSGAFGSGLRRVSQGGGELTLCTSLEKEQGEIHHGGPVPAWRDDSFLFLVIKGLEWEKNEVGIGYINGSPHDILTTGTLPFAILPDLFVVCRDHRLYGARVDVATTTLLHEPVLIPEIRIGHGSLGLPQVWVSRNGHLAYVEGEIAMTRALHVLDREGRGTACSVSAKLSNWPDFSPDGKHLAFAGIVETSQELFSWQWEQDQVEVITFNTPTYEGTPSWSVDGEDVRYSMHIDGVYGVYARSRAGVGDPRLITTVRPGWQPSSWLPDGSGFAVVDSSPVDGAGGLDIWIVRRGTDGWQQEQFLDRPANESAPAFSPDGRFLAYASDESGRSEVYVVPYPDQTDRWRVSQHGGSAPRWSAKGELFFKNGGEIWAASYTTEPTFESSIPTKLFDTRELLGSPVIGRFDVSPDGEHFGLFVETGSDPGQPEPVIRIVLNWVETWRDLLPEK